MYVIVSLCNLLPLEIWFRCAAECFPSFANLAGNPQSLCHYIVLLEAEVVSNLVPKGMRKGEESMFCNFCTRSCISCQDCFIQEPSADGFPSIKCHAAHVLNRQRISKVQVLADCKSLGHSFPMRALLIKDGLKAS